MFPFTRHQLAAYSPLSATSLVAAFARRTLHGREEVERAQSLVAAEFEAERAVLVDSGCSALTLAIELALSTSGSQRTVAIPAFQCFEVATAAVAVDCAITLYDIDPVSLGPDLESLERALRLGARAVVIAPLYGVPVNWEAVVALTNKYGAVPIEDAAQANGAEWNGRRLGSLGPLSVLSFGRGKGWTGGGGGALLLRGETAISQSIAHAPITDPSATREWRVVAIAMIQLMFGRPSLYGVPAAVPALGLGETHYHEPSPATTIASFSAALMRRTLDASLSEAAARRQHAAHWMSSLPRNLLNGAPPVLPRSTAGYLRFPLRIQADAAHLVATDASRRAGIARSYPRPLGDLPAVMPRLVESSAQYPGAVALARELITLPTHSLLTDSDREVIVALTTRWASAGAAVSAPRL